MQSTAKLYVSPLAAVNLITTNGKVVAYAGHDNSVYFIDLDCLKQEDRNDHQILIPKRILDLKFVQFYEEWVLVVTIPQGYALFNTTGTQLSNFVLQLGTFQFFKGISTNGTSIYIGSNSGNIYQTVKSQGHYKHSLIYTCKNGINALQNIGKQLWAGLNQGFIQIIEPGQGLLKLIQLKSRLSDILIQRTIKEKGIVAAGDSLGVVHLFDSVSFQLKASLQSHARQVVSLINYGNKLISVGEEGVITQTDLKQLQQVSREVSKYGAIGGLLIRGEVALLHYGVKSMSLVRLGS